MRVDLIICKSIRHLHEYHTILWFFSIAQVDKQVAGGQLHL
jgi:hypothetical protein